MRTVKSRARRLLHARSSEWFSHRVQAGSSLPAWLRVELVALVDVHPSSPYDLFSSRPGYGLPYSHGFNHLDLLHACSSDTIGWQLLASVLIVELFLPQTVFKIACGCSFP